MYLTVFLLILMEKSHYTGWLINPCTFFGNKLSSVARLCYGVSQGSVLGLLLFLYYINNLPSSQGYKIIPFADDTTLVSADGTNQVRIMSFSIRDLGKANVLDKVKFLGLSTDSQLQNCSELFIF